VLKLEYNHIPPIKLEVGVEPFGSIDPGWL
jgi:hypothetical protein